MNNPWADINPPSKDVTARRIDHEHPLDLFWARDHMGRYLFIYEFSSEADLPKINPPDLVGIQIFYAQAIGNITRNRLILILREDSNWEIFFSLCNDLVQATCQTNDTSSAITVILKRLARWQEFLKKSRIDLLSEEEIKGLIGELLFIKNHLLPTFGIDQAINFWQGPEGLPQDFNVNDSAIEVKCQNGATSPYVKISSIDQLCPQLPEMYMFVVTLGKTNPESDSAINLPNLISFLKGMLQSAASNQMERFNDLLHLLGYIDLDHYRDFSYVLIDEKIYQVIDGFPRICPKDIRRGIVNLSYQISLAECEPFLKFPDWMKSPT